MKRLLLWLRWQAPSARELRTAATGIGLTPGPDETPDAFRDRARREVVARAESVRELGALAAAVTDRIFAYYGAIQPPSET
jgi:hypothetical protein